MDIASVRVKVDQMSEFADDMLGKTYRGFMEHDTDVLNEALKVEDNLNRLEKEVNISAVEVYKGEKKLSEKDREYLMTLTKIADDLESIGDHCKDMIERIEIKIQEKLLFSDDAVAEYDHLYQVVKAALSQLTNALKKDDVKFVNSLLCDEGHVNELVDKYRQNHAKRLLEGRCSPMAGNMYVNLLDFTAAIYNRAKQIALSLKKIK